MPRIAAEYLRGRRNTLEFQVWSKWLDAASLIADRHMQQVDDDDPFAYNETASVSILTAAAALAGYVGLAEFSTRKINAADKSEGWGRSDFWMLAQSRSWAFEFKQVSSSAPPLKRLRSSMKKAEFCASQTARASADVAVAGLIASTYYIDSKPKLKQAHANLMGFADECDYAWRILGQVDQQTYIYFNICTGAS